MTGQHRNTWSERWGSFDWYGLATVLVCLIALSALVGYTIWLFHQI